MIYTGLNNIGEVKTIFAHASGVRTEVSEVYADINYQNPIYYKSRTITGQAPLSYKALGQPLTDYLISGNTVQNGTPTPDAPVDVVGCGVWDETHQSYKLPIAVNGTEHPIYLGQVESTRRIKKLVLTGTGVDGNSNITQHGIIYITPTVTLKSVGAAYCTHFKYVNQSQGPNMPSSSFTTSSGAGISLWFKTDYITVADFKSYLASQYAEGTPVTIWYVLAEPMASVVNEPLHKIGDYADTISFAQAEMTIPTSDGDNIISFGTTVQPSQVSITGNIKPTT